MFRPDLKKADKETIAYIEYLEGQVSGADNVILEIRFALDVIAKELHCISTGTECTFIYLTDDFKEKSYEKLMGLIDKQAKIRALSSKPIEEPTEDKPVEEIKVDDTFKPKNIQDMIKFKTK